MNTKSIVILSVVAVLSIIAIVFAVNYQKRKNAEAQAEALGDSAEAQAQLLQAQAEAQEACKSNWLCALNSVLGGVGSLTGGLVGLGGLGQ